MALPLLAFAAGMGGTTHKQAPGGGPWYIRTEDRWVMLVTIKVVPACLGYEAGVVEGDPHYNEAQVLVHAAQRQPTCGRVPAPPTHGSGQSVSESLCK